MSKEEQLKIYGGLDISYSLLNTLIKFTTTSLELGRTLGTLIRRAIEKNKCK